MVSKGNAVVLGGSGFMGSHVADALTDVGFKVRVFDLCQSPYLKGNQEMVLGDLMNPDEVMQAISGADYVYNFAGVADIDEAHANPVRAARLNVLGVVNTLEASKACGVKRYVFASSLYVYSNKGSFYRASKQAAERFIETYHECYGLEYTILRYGSLYGRRADRRNSIYRFIHDALTKGTITYNGTGNELREYIYAVDAAKMSVDILAQEYANQHIILTGNERMSVADIVKMINEMFDGNVKCSFVDKENRETHYTITPYSFSPKIGKKLINVHYTDLGQGILDCIGEVHKQLDPDLHIELDWLVKRTPQ